MSADNWAVCPKCKAEHERSKAEFAERVEESYGKVPAAKWEEMKLQLAEFDKPLEATFREDYEQGVDEDGEYSCSYHGGCRVCNCEHLFKITQKVKI